jgi:hypothetical protein
MQPIEQQLEKDMVWLWKTLFHYLRYISIFQYFPRSWRTHKVVDWWVFGNMIGSFAALIISRYVEFAPVRYFIVFYGLIRTFEIFVYQTNVLLFDEVNGRSSVKSYKRTILLLLHNFVEIIFWFACSYVNLLNYFDIPNQKGTVIQAVYISFVTMTTFGPPNFNIKNIPSMYLIMGQSVIGLFMTLISLARFLSLLPKPWTDDPNERDPGDQTPS